MIIIYCQYSFMKPVLFISLLFSTMSYAHEPFLTAPISTTDNHRILITAGYSEEALNSEIALKDATFTITDPHQNVQTVQSNSTLKSASTFDLELPIEGTYKIQSVLSHQLQYTYFNDEWRTFFNIPANKVTDMKDRTFVIPSDFTTAPKLTEVTREWTIKSYVSKQHSSPLKEESDSSIHVNFSTHPTDIKANEPIVLKTTYQGLPLTDAEITIRSLGQNDEQAKHFTSDKSGQLAFKFPHTGQYLISVSQKFNPKVKPTLQRYTLISLSIR